MTSNIGFIAGPMPDDIGTLRLMRTELERRIATYEKLGLPALILQDYREQLTAVSAAIATHELPLPEASASTLWPWLLLTSACCFGFITVACCLLERVP